MKLKDSNGDSGDESNKKDANADDKTPKAD